MSSHVPFQMELEQFRRIGYRAVDLAAEHLAAIRSRPVFQCMTEAERNGLMGQSLPERGIPPGEILDFIGERIFSHPMGNGHPRFFGWVNSPPTQLAVITELLAAALNPSCAGGDHAAIYLEHCAVRWLMELVGFPTEGSMGLLVSGGSMASLTGLTAARHWAARKHGWNVREEGLQGNHGSLILYISSETHSCVRKAAELLGLGEVAIRTIPVDANFRIQLPQLRAAIEQDRSRGLVPFCVVGNAGTVNTGAIDPLEGLAELCAELDLWLHVDGAYGAIGTVDPDLAPRYRGLERAQSIGLDPHKWLCVPVECGCALVRDGDLLRDAFTLVPGYLRTEPGKGFGGLPWYSEYGFQQSRGFRALKLWATLVHAGSAGVSDLVRRQNRMARWLAARIDAIPELERLAPVELSVVCFRYAPVGTGKGEEYWNARNQQIMETIQVEGEAFVTGASLRGKFALRACVLHYATTEEDLEALVATVLRVGARLSA